MACMRCSGLLVADEFSDLWEFNGPTEFQGVRCLNCGYIGDAVIMANKLEFPPSHRAHSVGSGRQGWGWGLEEGAA